MRAPKQFCKFGHELTDSNRNKRDGSCLICKRRRAKEWGKKHRKYLSFQRRKQRSFNPSLYELNKIRERMSQYSLEPSFYFSLLAKQDGKCAICGVPISEFKVDHSHVTGQVRGLLCHSCNIGISWFKDNPVILKNASDYLSRNNQ